MKYHDCEFVVPICRCTTMRVPASPYNPLHTCPFPRGPDGECVTNARQADPKMLIKVPPAAPDLAYYTDGTRTSRLKVPTTAPSSPSLSHSTSLANGSALEGSRGGSNGSAPPKSPSSRREVASWSEHTEQQHEAQASPIAAQKSPNALRKSGVDVCWWLCHYARTSLVSLRSASVVSQEARVSCACSPALRIPHFTSDDACLQECMRRMGLSLSDRSKADVRALSPGKRRV